MSPAFKARIAGAFYLGTFLAGAFSLIWVNNSFAANLIATLSYVVVTILFYDLFKPVNRTISLLAACFSLAGCAASILTAFHLNPIDMNSLVFFGCYCILIGYLIWKSTFLPRILGPFMVLGGFGWLTFISPTFAASLAPFNVFPGMLGEGALTLWLLIAGVNAQRWKEQSSATIVQE
jgi:hypothetical protein